MPFGVLFVVFRHRMLRGGTLKDCINDCLLRLLCVKSIVTILLASVFCVLALRGAIAAEQYLTIFTMIISFYFGTQHERM